ncbi:hypothetical protein GCM10023189_42950 [Nibrella saemangeumensis]|uniref:Helix-turn-helix domain-containing protein n=1 Tax=Nibrella saemangeumensis TaxID=1084526 RepID=A0ABP8NDR3_9BACT
MIVVPDIVLENDKLTDSAKIAFGRLVVLCQVTGETDILHADLCRILRCKERNLHNLLRELETGKLIETRRGAANRRIIRLTADAQENAQDCLTVLQHFTASVQGSGAKNCSTAKKCTSAEKCSSAKNCTTDLQKIAVVQNFAPPAQIENQEVTSGSAKNCTTPDTFDNKIYNNINNTSSIDNTTITKSYNFFVEKREILTHFAEIYCQGQAYTCDSLGPSLKLRGYSNEAVGAFVLENRGNHYNSKAELTTVVRNWLKAKKAAEPKKAFQVAGTIDERKTAFREQIRAFAANHSGKYPADMYNQFYAYWTILKKGDLLAFELATKKDGQFDLAGRLAYWNTKYKPANHHGTNNRTGHRSEKRLGLVNLEDSADEHHAPGTEMQSGYAGRLYINLE